jgi:uncharacterized surface protein with fasciclin (FAS1) repeats
MKQSTLYYVLGGAVLVGIVGFTLMNSQKSPSMEKKTEMVQPTVAMKEPEEKVMNSKTIVDVAVEAGNFKTLVAAVKAAGLVETLSGAGPFTVFAPTDEAFAKLPAGTVEALLKDKAKLAKILTYHVVAGKVMAKDVVGMTSAKTVEGGEVDVNAQDGKVMINDATVTATDIEASNGVIHVIDTVLIPKE